METRVKQRITGAVVLVALIVVVVPALLTDPRPAKSGDARVTSVPGVPALQSYRSDLKAAPTQVGTPSNVESPQANADDAVAPVVAPIVGGEADKAPEPAKAIVPVPAKAAASAPALTPPAKQAATPKPAPAAPPSKSSPEKSVAAGWAIQLGGFASRANAEKLIGDLKRQGFSAFVSDASTSRRPLFRVRVGPSKDRASAETLRKRLKSAGHAGSVVPNP